MRIFMLLGLLLTAACSSGETDRSAAANSAANNMAEASGITPGAVAPSAPAAAPITLVMPDFAPQYSGSVIRSVNSSQAGTGGASEVHLATKDDAAEIFDFYRTKFAAAGLQKTSEFLSGGTGMMSAAGKARRAAIAIAKERHDNIIIVTYSGS